jgi:hypothetical protein
MNKKLLERLTAEDAERFEKKYGKKTAMIWEGKKIKKDNIK